MTCEVHNKEINTQCAELSVRPLYLQGFFIYTLSLQLNDRTGLLMHVQVQFRCYNNIFTSNKICIRYDMKV